MSRPWVAPLAEPTPVEIESYLLDLPLNGDFRIRLGR
jgi:ABC-type cobalt transport system substrate-binding protein